jgi:hypothetical protein
MLAPDARPLVFGFDFTTAIRRICDDMVRRLAELGHVEMTRVAVSFAQARCKGPWGTWASLTPMRFAGGAETTTRRGRPYGIQRLVGEDGREMLYLLTFYLPRFLDQTFTEKLTTVVHELWHIGPAFDGDLRRHEGRCFAHGTSQRQFDELAARLGQRWLSLDPPQDLYAFLRLSFAELSEKHGGIYGCRIPRPKLIPILSNPPIHSPTALDVV